MNRIKNHVQLIGNAGDSPEVTNLENGNKKVRFSLATNEYFKNALGDKVKRTYWHTIIAWDKVAEIIEKHVHKGKEIIVEGKLASRSYKDKQDVKHYVTEVIASEILLLGKVENNPKSDEDAL